MARHKANHIQVAYANSAEEADEALLAKAAMAEAMGMEVSHLRHARRAGRSGRGLSVGGYGLPVAGVVSTGDSDNAVESRMAAYLSRNGWYAVECPDDKVEETRRYVHAVEDIIPALQEVFSPLTPSFDRFKVDFGDKGPCYCAGGTIHLPASMDFESPENRYGGLFHETVHGFVEHYVHRPEGINVHSEALVIIVQVAALCKVNEEGASKYRNGHGSDAKVHPWLEEFGRVLDDPGFDPIRRFSEQWASHRAPSLPVRQRTSRT